MPTPVINMPDRLPFLRIDGVAPELISTSTTAAQSAAALSEGVYALYATALTFVKIAATADDVTAITGFPVPAGTLVYVFVPSGYKIGGILGASTGTLYTQKVS